MALRKAKENVNEAEKVEQKFKLGSEQKSNRGLWKWSTSEHDSQCFSFGDGKVATVGMHTACHTGK